MLHQGQPIIATSPYDPTSGANPDGLTAVCCKDQMFVYGGWHADRVWRLDLPSSTWTEHITHGDVPPARIHHAADVYKGQMIICGGERLNPPVKVENYLMPLPYYEMSCDTFEWMAIECFGTIPVARSHHTANVVGDMLIVIGGKPCDGRPLTASVLAESKRNGFYDIYILQIVSRSWRKVEMYDPASPMVWGHGSAVFRESFLLLACGFDVSAPDIASTGVSGPASYAIDSAPVATLTNVVHILRIDNMTWMRYTPEKGEAAPVPRAFVCSFGFGAELIMFGGMTIDHIGRAINVNECWIWSVEYGRWSKLEFCVPSWMSKKLISSLHGSQLLVAPQLNSLFFLDLGRRGVGWQRAPCIAGGRPIESAPEPAQERLPVTMLGPPTDEDDKFPTRPGLMPTAAPNPSGQLPGPPFPSHRSSSKSAEYESEVEHLRHEVNRLRAQLQAKEQNRILQEESQLRPFRAGGSELLDSDLLPPPEDFYKPVAVGSFQHWSDVARSASQSATQGAQPEKSDGRQPRNPYSVSSPNQRKRPFVITSEPLHREKEKPAPPPEELRPTGNPFLGTSPHSGSAAALRNRFEETARNPTTTAAPVFRYDEPPPGTTAKLLNTATSPEIVLPSMARYRLLQEQRAELSRMRREKLRSLQQRIAQLEASSMEQGEKAKLVKAIREETARLEAAVDAQIQTEQQTILEELQREPAADSVEYGLGADSGPIRTSPRLARARNERRAVKGKPLLYEEPAAMDEFPSMQPSTSRVVDFEPHRSVSPIARHNVERGAPSQPSATAQRSVSPLKDYWAELQNALSQAPIVRPRRP
jgi:hypothetical protein